MGAHLDIARDGAQIQGFRPTNPSPTDLAALCRSFHGESVPTAYCVYGDCFEVNDGDAVSVVAGDDEGPFPKTWFAWHDGIMTVPPAAEHCILEPQGKKKTRVNIPGGGFRCVADVRTDEYIYYEHFGSNPTTGCLGWLECRKAVTTARPKP